MKQALLLILFCLALFTAGLVNAEPIVRGEPITPDESASLPPVCKLILIERPMAHIDHIARAKNADVLAKPENRMARNNGALHHWCWAIVSRTRYFNATTSDEKYKYNQTYHIDMDFIIRNSPPDWEFLPQMFVENGEMYFWRKDYAAAVGESLKALRLNPDFAKAYILQTNTYNALHQKDKALSAATEGLKRNPTSRALKRLYGEVGGKPPYPTPYPLPQAQEPENAIPTPATVSPQDASSAIDQTKPSEPPAAPPTSPAESAPKPDPYCRFCP